MECAQQALLASLPAADAMFMRMLSQAEAMQQFMALHALLEEVWDSGYAFEDQPEKPPAAAQPVAEPTPDGTTHQQEDTTDRKYEEMRAAPKLVKPELTSAATQKQQPEERSSSAPGTPPAEESRWPSSASMQGTVDGWQEELPLPTGSWAALHRFQPEALQRAGMSWVSSPCPRAAWKAPHHMQTKAQQRAGMSWKSCLCPQRLLLHRLM